MNKEENELQVWLWLWLPVSLFIVIFVAAFNNSNTYGALFRGEFGLIEVATPLMLMPAIVSGFLIFLNREKFITKQLGAWVLFVTMACIYFAGEEISWGQQLLGWETPKWIEEINDQHETNLHNMSSWFDQKPRLLLEILVLVGGIYLPLKRMLLCQHLPSDSWQYWLYPSKACLPTAVLAILSRVPDRLEKLFDSNWMMFNVRLSEVQELYFAIFLMIYLLSIKKRQLSYV
ncbi:MAG: hypothetical protein O7D86_05920 [Proteobacteria bacterium]|nr:hypothetical protein [Pseudomonadota bacterium]